MIPEWLPDWRDESVYPDPETTHDAHWAWEFLRRNPSYQRDFDLFMAHVPEHHRRRLEFLSKRYSVQRATKEFRESVNRYRSIIERYSIQRLANPATEFSVPGPAALVFDSNQSVHFINPFIPKSGDDLSPVYQYVCIDMTKQISPQIEALKQHLESYQKHLSEEGLVCFGKFRNTKDKYRNYLRLLDGNLCGATTDELMDGVFRMKDSYPDRSGRQRVEDSLKAAQKLQDYNYRFIIKPPPRAPGQK